MKKVKIITLLTLAASGATCLAALPSAKDKPNVVFVYCDDLGYGDIQVYNPEHGKILTPSADKLASQGMMFTDAHSAASVCTPSRYALLTGRYSWRSKLQTGVARGYAPSLIDEDRLTVAGFLKEQGYYTAVIGKWHLNFQFLDPETGEVISKRDKREGKSPIGVKIPDGPTTRGFDFYHGHTSPLSKTMPMMRSVVENGTVIGRLEVIDVLPDHVRAAVELIDDRAKNHPGQPFFLYFSLNAPHTPIVPTEEWTKKQAAQSGLVKGGPYAAFVMQTDAALGAVMDALKRNGLDDNTIVIFTSDNGCSRAAGIPQLEEQGHYVSAEFRGSKNDLWEGGHRVPFIVRWPGTVEAGSISDQTICQVDFFATLSDITGSPIPEPYAEDSVSFYPALLGEPIPSSRAGIIHHTFSGHFGYREGKWKLLLARGSGGWTAPDEAQALAKGLPEAQLYDLENDPGETNNLYKTNPEVAQRLLHALEEDVFSGRSTVGPPSQNDTDKIVLWKSGRD